MVWGCRRIIYWCRSFRTASAINSALFSKALLSEDDRDETLVDPDCTEVALELALPPSASDDFDPVLDFDCCDCCCIEDLELLMLRHWEHRDTIIVSVWLSSSLDTDPPSPLDECTLDSSALLFESTLLQILGLAWWGSLEQVEDAVFNWSLSLAAKQRPDLFDLPSTDIKEWGGKVSILFTPFSLTGDGEWPSILLLFFEEELIFWVAAGLWLRLWWWWRRFCFIFSFAFSSSTFAIASSCSYKKQ